VTLDLTDQEKLALAAELKRAINEDRYPLSPRVQTLKAILARLEPPALAAEPLPPRKRYAPPRAQRRTRSTVAVLGVLSNRKSRVCIPGRRHRRPLSCPAALKDSTLPASVIVAEGPRSAQGRRH